SRERPDRCQHPTTRTAARNSSCIHRGVHRWRMVQEPKDSICPAEGRDLADRRRTSIKHNRTQGKVRKCGSLSLVFFHWRNAMLLRALGAPVLAIGLATSAMARSSARPAAEQIRPAAARQHARPEQQHTCINDSNNGTGTLDPNAANNVTTANGQSGSSGGNPNDRQRRESSGTSNPTPPVSTTMTSPDTQQACR
ncbi:hypothetical protein FHT71_005406, partial [Rhizobium sp. BK060]|nr:hypothetical protein [Rhizobium sp. BK060]